MANGSGPLRTTTSRGSDTARRHASGAPAGSRPSLTQRTTGSARCLVRTPV